MACLRRLRSTLPDPGAIARLPRRQKNRGMQWSQVTSEGLAALRTLLLNGGWERYWVEREVLPWAEAVAARPRKLCALTQFITRS